MLTVSKAALNVIKNHMSEQGISSAVRITMMGGCCIGENLRFTLGKKQPDDLLFVFDRVTFLVDRGLSAQCGAIQVDFAQEYDHCPCSGRNGGFSISSERHSFRCCSHSFRTGGAGCWNLCPADCIGILSDSYQHDKEPPLRA